LSGLFLFWRFSRFLWCGVFSFCFCVVVLDDGFVLTSSFYLLSGFAGQSTIIFTFPTNSTTKSPVLQGAPTFSIVYVIRKNMHHYVALLPNYIYNRECRSPLKNRALRRGVCWKCEYDGRLTSEP
jgi:hypothetical protein